MSISSKGGGTDAIGARVRRPRLNLSGFVREGIFGVNDGLVATVGLVSGEALAHQSHHAILIAAISAAGAAVVSMSVGSYLATQSENDFERRAIRQQASAITRAPGREHRHVRRLLADLGVPAAAVPPVAANIVQSRQRWLNFMVREHLGIHPERRERPLANAVAMGLAVIVGSSPPVVPYLLPLPLGIARDLSWALAVASALALGAVKGRVTASSVAKSALAFGVLVSLSSAVGAAIGFGLGALA